MKRYDEMNPVERQAFHERLRLTGDEPLGIDGIFPDGTRYDWDPALKATVETAPDGRRFVIELRDGELIRKRELAPSTPAIAV